MAETKKKKRWWKVLLIVLGTTAGLFALLVGGYNGIKYWRYSTFYSLNQKMRKNPGLNDGYITQGLVYYEEEDKYLTSGYMMGKGEPSRVYSIDKDENVHYASLYRTVDGVEKAYTYHSGGMAEGGDDYFIVCGSDSLYFFPKGEILGADKAVASFAVQVEPTASFVFSDADKVYVGEFNDGDSYATEHKHRDSYGNDTYAIVAEYSLADLLKGSATPLREYAIRDRVQGFCVTSSGRIVMDTSWGINASNYYVYGGFAGKIDEYDGDIPVTWLDDRYLMEDFEGPAMAEDLDYHDGRVLVASEAASNKYIFGKLFFYWDINGLSIE